MKTGSSLRLSMAPIVMLILGKVLDYLADHSEEVIQAIKDQFLSAQTDVEVKSAVQQLGYEPNEENLTKLHDVLQSKGEDPEKLAAILVNKATA